MAGIGEEKWLSKKRVVPILGTTLFFIGGWYLVFFLGSVEIEDLSVSAFVEVLFAERIGVVGSMLYTIVRNIDRQIDFWIFRQPELACLRHR